MLEYGTVIIMENLNNKQEDDNSVRIDIEKPDSGNIVRDEI